MLINLSTTRILMDLLRVGPAGRMVSNDVDEMTLARKALAAAPGVPLRIRLLPRSLRAGLARRVERRAMADAILRLSKTSPHLLADIGLMEDPVDARRPRAPKARLLAGSWPTETRPAMPEEFRIAAE